MIEDLNEIQLLNKKLFDEEFEKYDKTINSDWSLSREGENFYKERIRGKNSCAFVLVKEQKVIGYLVASMSGKEFYRNINNVAELDDMYVLEEYRDKGYGGLLYEKFVRWCKKSKVERVKVLVTAKNKQAVKFYKRKGLENYNVTLEMKI